MPGRHLGRAPACGEAVRAEKRLPGGRAGARPARLRRFIRADPLSQRFRGSSVREQSGRQARARRRGIDPSGKRQEGRARGRTRMHLSQVRRGATTAVVARDGASAAIVNGVASTYDLAREAADAGRGLQRGDRGARPRRDGRSRRPRRRGRAVAALDPSRPGAPAPDRHRAHPSRLCRDARCDAHQGRRRSRGRPDRLDEDVPHGARGRQAGASCPARSPNGSTRATATPSPRPGRRSPCPPSPRMAARSPRSPAATSSPRTARRPASAGRSPTSSRTM